MIDKFCARNEDKIIKYMHLFAKSENERLRKTWGVAPTMNKDGSEKKITKKGGRTSRELSQRTLDRVKRLRNKGWSLEDIAAKLDLSVYRTQKYLTELKLGRISTSSLPKRAQQILQLLHLGTSISKIAMFADMTVDEVNEYIEHYNLVHVTSPKSKQQPKKPFLSVSKKNVKVGDDATWLKVAE